MVERRKKIGVLVGEGGAVGAGCHVGIGGGDGEADVGAVGRERIGLVEEDVVHLALRQRARFNGLVGDVGAFDGVGNLFRHPHAHVFEGGTRGHVEADALDGLALQTVVVGGNIDGLVVGFGLSPVAGAERGAVPVAPPSLPVARGDSGAGRGSLGGDGGAGGRAEQESEQLSHGGRVFSE